MKRFDGLLIIARLRNNNATDDGNVDFRSLKKIYIQSLENKYKVVDLPVEKLLNDMTLDIFGLISANELLSTYTRQT